MAIRKATEDVLARTQAEREVVQKLEAEGLFAGTGDGPVTTGQTLLSEFPTVEFETGVSRMPGGEKVAVRRLVITGPWVVDPNGGRWTSVAESE